ncbi:hypothetical protein [Streptomyces sp. NPDC056480]
MLVYPGFDLSRRAVVPPAGVAWPSTVPMSEDAAALVWGSHGTAEWARG